MDRLRRLFKETVIGFRSSLLLSTLSILTVTFTLFLLGLFYLFYVNVNQIALEMDRRVQLVIYLADGATVEEVERMRVGLFQRPEVKSARYISKQEALERFREELGEDSSILEGLGLNPLPASIEVDFKEGHFDQGTIREIAGSFEENEHVESVEFGATWLDRLQLVKTLIAAIGTAGGGLLLAVALVIIGSAIRMSVFTRKTELLVMKMVGCADWTIKGPFLMEGLIEGTIGGILASLLSLAVYHLVDSRLIGLALVPLYYPLALTLVGVVLGAGGTYLSVTGQLRKLW